MKEGRQIDKARLESLVRISQYQAKSLQDFLDYALDEIIALTKSKFGYLFFYNEITKQFTINTWSKSAVDVCNITAPHSVYDLDKTGLWGEAVRQAKPIVVNDFAASDLLKKGFPEGHPPLHRFMTMPVFGQGRIVAVLGLANKKAAYTDADVHQVALLIDSIWPIARRKQVEDSLTRSQQMLKQAIDAMPVRIFWKDGNLKYLGCNKRFAREAGLKSPEEIIGKTDYDLAWKDLATGYEKHDLETIRSGKPQIGYEEEYHLTDQDRRLWLRKHKVPLTGTDGKTIGLLGTYEDITEDKKDQLRIARLAAIVEASDDAIIGANIEGLITDWNSGAKRIYGYSEAEIIGQPLSKLAPPDKQAEVVEILDAIRAGRHTGHYETRRMRKSGEQFHISSAIAAIRDKNSRLVGFSIIGRDVTERKKSEAELERFHDFIVNIADACFEFDLHGRATFCNESTHRLLGYTREEYLSLHHHERYATKEKADRLFRLFNELYRNNLPVKVCESDMLCKDGSEITMEMSVSLIRDDEGVIMGFRGVGRDITARKKAQTELERYRDFIENIGDGCFEIDMTGKVTYVNEVIGNRMGYTRGELIGVSTQVYAGAEEVERMLAIFKQICETGEPATVDDFIARDKNGATRYISMTVSLIRGASGVPVGFRGTTRDVTEKKRAQAALEQSEARYRSIFQFNQAIMLLNDPETGAIVDANLAACAYYQYTRDKLLGMKITDITASPKEEVFAEITRDKDEECSHYYFEHRLATGEVHPVEVSSGPIEIGGKKLLYSIIHDITARRKAEQALRMSEEKYRTILENISEGYIEYDLAGNFIFVNHTACMILGYTREELSGMNYRQVVSEDTGRKMYDVYNKIFKTGKPETLLDFEIIQRNGARILVELNSMLIRNNEGNPIGYRVMARDVTARRKAEENLRASEEKYRSIMESIMEGYLEYDLEGNFTFVNDAACTMMGYPREELLTMNYKRLIGPETAKILDQTTRDIVATGAPRKLVDFEVIRKDGTRRIHQHNLTVTRNLEGKPAGVRAMGRDVTELKWAEEALRQSEERIRLLFRNIPVPTFVWKAQHDQYVLSEFNSAAFQFIGDKLIDSLGKPAQQFFVNIPQIAADIARCMDLKRNAENQFWYNFDDRSEKRYVIVKYAFAPPDSVLMHVNDITGQKRAEENLQFISIHDSLTGLCNRFYSDAEISRLAASRMRPVSVIIIDLNNLKKINDEYGHAIGDLYIKNTANILKQTFRPEDMIARIGGDEFMVLLPLVDESTCAQAIERLNEYIRLFNQESEFPISLSAGFATAQAGDNLQDRIREADQRMYEDKAAFKASYDPSLNH